VSRQCSRAPALRLTDRVDPAGAAGATVPTALHYASGAGAGRRPWSGGYEYRDSIITTPIGDLDPAIVLMLSLLRSSWLVDLASTIKTFRFALPPDLASFVYVHR
jgi:hypothetical protein